MEFFCKNPDAEYTADQFWKGNVICMEQEGHTIVLKISGKGSRILAVVGKYRHGNYICIPEWGVGSPLSSLSDRFWNQEQLERYLSRPDAITVSEALNIISKEGMA